MPSIFGESSLLDVFMKSLKIPVANTSSTKDSEDNDENVDDASKINVDNDQVFENNLEYIKTLKDEIEGLKCLLKTTSCLFESQPIADITYFDNDLSRKFRTSIENFINTKFSEDTNNNDESKNKKAEEKEPTPLARSIYFKDYTINSFGQPSNLETSENKFWEIPRYDVDNEKTIGETHEMSNGSCIKKKIKMACFNCGGEHSIVNCPDEKDQARINANKNNFINSTPSSNKDVSRRYHQEESKFHDMKPGVLSDRLKEALGIGENDLPPYIYQMRLFGYPPGYLQQAKISKQEMIMFGTNGEVESSGGHLEDGELLNEETDQTYDPTKFIQYPGFNVQTSADVVDDHLRMHMPAMQPYHEIHFMIHHLNKKTSNESPRIKCKRKAIDEIGISNSAKKNKLNEDEDTHVIDMEIDSDFDKDNLSHQVPFIPPLPPSQPESPQSPPPPPDSSFHFSSPKNSPSFSMKLDSTVSSADEITIDSPSQLPDYPESPSVITIAPSFASITNIPTSPTNADIKKCDGYDTVSTTTHDAADTTMHDNVNAIIHDSSAYIVIDDATDDEDYVINIDEDEVSVKASEDVESKIQKKSQMEAEAGFDNDTTEQILSLKVEESTYDKIDLISFETPTASEDQNCHLKFGLGTPLVPLSSSFQTFDSLPPLEKFSEGVAEIVISEETQIGSFHKIQQLLKRRKK